MAVLGNTLSEIGDVIIIETQMSVTATNIALNSFTDVLVGETGSRFFTKMFRVSQDGLIFTSWLDLTNINLQSIQGKVYNNTIFFQFRYERSGTDNTGLLEFVSVNVVGSVVPSNCSSPLADNSIFKGLSCGNFLTAQLCSNLLKKLYKKGIIPDYIVRGGSTQEDEDYIAFWSSIACYMSMFVTYMQKFDTIYMDRDLLVEHLEQRNSFFCTYEETLEDLQYISRNFFDEIRKRGTIHVLKRKGYEFKDGSSAIVNGEILRLLCIGECDEFLAALLPPENIGWNVGNCSPMYKHTLFEDQYIKGFEQTKDAIDITKYQTFGNVSIVTDGSRQVLQIEPGGGIGYDNFNSILPIPQGIIVDPNIDYEVTLQVKVDDSGTEFNFGAMPFDCFDNKYIFEEIDGAFDNYFFLEDSSLGNSGMYYFIRGIIYKNGTPNISGQASQTNINDGKNLRFKSLNTQLIMPYFESLSGNTSNIYVYDFKVRPLRRPYSLGFLNTYNFLEFWFANKNQKRTITEIYEIIRRYLVPYNSIPLLNDVTQNDPIY